MRRFTCRLQQLFLLAAAALLTFSACQKDNVAEVVIPVISNPGLKDGKDTIAVGETRVLRPQLVNAKEPTFLWLVNGVTAGTDSIYTFTPTAAGDYTISFKVSAGNSLNSYFYRIKVTDKYDNGFFLVNEGWFGHDKADVNFYRYGEDSLHRNIFQRENPGKTLGNTAGYGTVFNNRIYLVSKDAPLVIADVHSMKELGRTAQPPAMANAFCPVNNSTGLLSTTDGVYPVDLGSFAIGAKIAGIDGQVGGMLTAGNYVFVMSQSAGIVVLNASNFSIVSTLVKADVGLARTPDGTVWAGAGQNLYAINPTSLAVNTITLPFPLYGAWGAWNATMITASTIENAVFIAKTNDWGINGKQIFKYLPGNAASLQTPFITLPADRELYGAGFRYNPANNTLVATGVEPGYGTHFEKNTLFIYNASTGAVVKSIPYTGYFFPAIPVFN
ncbi:DUF5074 domain-containing protein [Chitinophaga oryzae]|uniref:DUF5074 domain-containing protein n=1 Tax=Chitinophaga oryzae TaxID=2725414 RepID=A0AAE6ZMG1_9BACT|nr:DUF5074 domain-containing protein [Chitinophaga oryzae]QJB34070.1 DUF5074 domain-containing protein [Chitinophaga oryzae]QJB40598.1 DUF5074 domain-containing protein [Chitinophaga oryzae]